MKRRNIFVYLVSLLWTLLVPPIAAETLSNGEDVEAFIRRKISGSNVVVFAKSYCPFCRRTLQLLDIYKNDIAGWTLDVLHLDQMGDDGPSIQMELLTQTGQKTVPNIFIQGQHIGGNSDLMELDDAGELEKRLLAIAGVKDEV